MDEWQRASVPKPDDALLDAAAAFRASLPLPRAEIVGVAGRAAETPVGYDAAKNELTLTTSGDGQSTTDLLHPDIPQWRIEAAHGDLASHAGAFGAYAELLASGSTSLLSRPQRVGAAFTTRPWVEDALLFPSNEELAAEAFASRADRTAQAEFPLGVSVTHGDLRVARYPVAVGHYLGDNIVSAEEVLDRQLGRRLSRRFQMALYPADFGSSEVVRDAMTSPPGAIIIGLGQVGHATADVVRRGIAAAALRYALSVVEDPGAEQGSWRSAAFSSVFIGTRGGSKLTIVEAIAAIVRGALDANRVLRRQKLWDCVRIDAIELIELIELYEQRAISAMYATRNAIADVASELETGERIDLVPLLRPTPSGQYRMPADEWHTGWWQRMSITMDSEGLDDDEETDDRPLKYLVLTDRARVEASLQCNDRGSTWHLIQSAIKTPRFDPELSGALFELLVPNEIKASADAAPRVVLILDAETAAYPWEVLADGSRADRMPQSVRSGMLRQFVAGTFRFSPRYSEVKNAFVVGDTAIDAPVGKDKIIMPKLPGAQAEAEAVNVILSEAGFQVKKLIRPSASEVQTQLFARPYRVLHLAGHGNYNADKPSESGMLLGPDIYLTACQLRQMRVVPDLVFINCCFLGQMDQPHRLAASVAQELIAMGVKAVVAAGWAVDDAAAVTFASTFYDQMLIARQPFGEAVREAREAVFRKHASTNTWAAYQCYGNPGFMLAEPSEDGVVRDGTQFCSRREYIDELCSLAAQANAVGSGDEGKPQRENLMSALRDLRAKIPGEWCDGELLMRVGFAWRELGDFAQAVEFLEQAIRHESASASIQSVEQLANLRIRRAIGLHREGNAAARDEEVARVLSLLELIKQIGPSDERWSLLGSAQKKLAAIAVGSARRDRLREAAKSYAQAARGTNVYPLLNQVAVEWLLNSKVSVKVRKQFNAAREFVDARRDSADFWARVGVPDYDLTRQLLDDALDVDALAKAYQQVAQQSGTDGQKRSVIEHHEFLADVIAEDPSRASLHAKLLELAARLRATWNIR